MMSVNDTVWYLQQLGCDMETIVVHIDDKVTGTTIIEMLNFS